MEGYDDFEYDDSEESNYEESSDSDSGDSEITLEEEGFLKGYNESEIYCANCNGLISKEAALKEVINGEREFFCSEECLNQFKKEQE